MSVPQMALTKCVVVGATVENHWLRRRRRYQGPPLLEAVPCFSDVSYHKNLLGNLITILILGLQHLKQSIRIFRGGAWEFCL